MTYEPSAAVAEHDTLLICLPVVDDVLNRHVSALGNDFVAYRNHVYRVLNLCFAIAGDRGQLEEIAVAAAFHDLGIWTERTFDYIDPSIALARDYLVANSKDEWIAEISTMIANHHKITPLTSKSNVLVESFRQADWIDVTLGFRRFGVPRALTNGLFATWPDAGFHWRLVQLAVHQFRAHPLKPLPMIRL